MGVFDPAKVKAQLLGEFGIEWMLRRDIDELRLQRSMFHYAGSLLNEAVQAILVDLDQEARKLLELAAILFESAISEREVRVADYTPGLVEATSYYQLALCKWLLENQFESALFDRACDYLTGYLRTKLPKEQIEYRLPIFLPARRYATLQGIYHSFKGLKPIDTRKTVGTPGKMSYVIALEFDRREPKALAILPVFERFLRSFMPICVGVHQGGAYGFLQDVPFWMLIQELHFQLPPVSSIARVKGALKYAKVRMDSTE